MTSRPIRKTPATKLADRFPEFPPRDDMQNSIYLDAPAHQAALSHHFGMSDTTIILSEVPIGRTVSQRQGLRVPDLLVAFGVDRAGVIDRHGYSIEEQGKPPDFVLEVASVTTGQNDYTRKRDDYAALGVPEYWRFDPSGGEYHDAPLAGDHLVGGVYQPIEVVQFGEGSYRGHSAALGLDLCWEDGQLRWYDPVNGRYLLTYDEEAAGRLEEAAGRLAAERERDAALEQVRELEDQVRRLQAD